VIQHLTFLKLAMGERRKENYRKRPDLALANAIDGAKELE